MPVPVIATSYPPWFAVMVWALVLVPLYPGLLLMAVGTRMTMKGREDGKKVLAIGLAFLAFGSWLVAHNWDSFSSGNPYNLF